MSGLLRTLDANANRAREALRTLEDTARFVLCDGELAACLKAARHELRAALDAAGLDALRLGAARDTPGDVGTGLSTPAESSRTSPRDIALAAGKRAGEALRVIEESLKPLQPDAALISPRVKALRYNVYECERRIVLALGTGRARQWRLCVLLTESLCRLPWLSVARAALAGGADCIQLREKNMEAGELLGRARALMALVRKGGQDVRPTDFRPTDVRPTDSSPTDTGPTDTNPTNTRTAIIINDRPDIALAAGADGVHLGQHDLPVATVRALAGERLLVGVSTHDMSEARAAAADGADYCGVGAMFATSTKPREVSGPAYLRQYLGCAATARIPHLAIGGIAADNIAQLAAAGCRGVAVSSAVCGAADPERVCRAMVAALGNEKRYGEVAAPCSASPSRVA